MADQGTVVIRGLFDFPDGVGGGAALLINDGGRHHNVQVDGLGDHRVGVDLSHVEPLVLRLDILDLECPGVLTVVDDVDPGIPGDHVPADG